MKKVYLYILFLMFNLPCYGCNHCFLPKKQDCASVNHGINALLPFIHGDYDKLIKVMFHMYFFGYISHGKMCRVAQQVWDQLTAISNMQIRDMINLTQ